MKLWIDDIRTPPDGWEWAKTSKEAIDVIDNNEVSHISFDHDLGGDDTTRKVVMDICHKGFNFPPLLSVHSANPVGRDWLLSMFKTYAPNSRVVRW